MYKIFPLLLSCIYIFISEQANKTNSRFTKMSEQQCKDYRKLCIKNVNEVDVDKVLNFCREFAEVISHNVHNNKGGNRNLCMVFPYFNSRNEASKTRDALMARGYIVDYANTKRQNEQQSSPNTSASTSANTLANALADFNVSDPYGICIRCGSHAYYNCARCDDFYCTQDCQRIDWPVHKLHCIPMPELVPSKCHPNTINGKTMKKPVNEPAPGHSSNDRSDGATAATTNGTTHEHEISPRQHKHSSVNGNDNVAAPTQPSSSTSSSAAAITPQVTANAIPMVKPIENDSKVIIVEVRDHKTLYIRSVATNEEYLTLMSDVAKAEVTAPDLKSYPTPRVDLVLAPFGGIYYRALVLECNKLTRSIRVAFIDFGNEEEVLFDQLKVLPDELAKRIRLTLKVKLKNVKENPEQKEAMAMKQFLENMSDMNTCKTLKVHGEDEYIRRNDTVELFDLDTNQSINEKLNRLPN